MVPLAEIADPKNDFNLNLPRYIDSTEPEDLQDIDGHLRGGIPERDLDALGSYWQVLPGVRAALFESAGRPGYARLKLPLTEVKAAILGHAEFTAFQQQATQALRRLAQGHDAPPHGLRQGRPPQGADRDHRRGPARRLPPGAAARRLRRLPAPDGLLGRDDAGRLLSHRRRRLGEGAHRARSFRSRTRTTSSLARAARLRRASGASSPTSFRRRSSSPATSPPNASHRSARQPARRRSSSSSTRCGRRTAARKAARRGDRGRGRQAEDHREGREGAAQGDRQGPALRGRARGARGARRTCSTSRPSPRPGARPRKRTWTRSSTPSTPSSPRPRSRRWWWTTSGWRACRPPCRASWTASRRPSPAASASWPNATPRRCRSSPTRWRRSPRGWTSTSRRWGRMEVRPGYKQTEAGVIPEDWPAWIRSRRYRRSGDHGSSPQVVSSAGVTDYHRRLNGRSLRTESSTAVDHGSTVGGRIVYFALSRTY